MARDAERILAIEMKGLVSAGTSPFCIVVCPAQWSGSDLLWFVGDDFCVPNVFRGTGG